MIQVSDQWLDAKRELLISEYRASHDIMTGLWNKTSGVDQVINCLENMSESDMAVLGFMDIDNFKSVNDTYGHETGVFWIREVATAPQHFRKCVVRQTLHADMAVMSIFFSCRISEIGKN